MSRTLSLLLLLVGLSATSSAFAQQPGQANDLQWYTVVRPWREGSRGMALSQSAAADTIPLWSYRINSSRDGHDYAGMIVGRSPFFHGARTTTISVFLIPLKIVMPDTGHVFDPTETDTSCLPAGATALSLSQQSPFFKAPSTAWIMNGANLGLAQYNDAFQRAQFFQNISATGNRYHTALSVTTLGAQTFDVPKGEGVTAASGGCGDIGEVDFATFDAFITGTLIPALAGQGVGPTNFPFFLLYNVVLTEPGLCCILGYHGAEGLPLQTYSPTDFDSTGIFRGVANTSVFAHEIGEWLNDPTGNNPTPAWGHTGQVAGCQNNLEVGDPLSGTDFPPVTMPNGFTYGLQELAFFSWFYGAPSIGAGGKFSNNGTFTSDAGPPCT